MVYNLALLSNEDLQNLFTAETNHFMIGVDNSLAFEDLKSIRVNLRQIAAELNKMNIPLPGCLHAKKPD